MGNVTAVPGGSVVMKVQVRKYDGSLAVLDAATITTTVSATGHTDEPANQIITPDSQTRLIVVSGAQTAARAGKQITLRAFITPSGSYETVASEAKINVGL